MLIATACSGSSAPTGTTATVTSAEAAEAELQLTSALDTTELVDVRTGEPTSLNDIVTGDRAVLLWYWAPN